MTDQSQEGSNMISLANMEIADRHLDAQLATVRDRIASGAPPTTPEIALELARTFSESEYDLEMKATILCYLLATAIQRIVHP